MATIGLADVGGLPVSTTHVLSSGVAGTMWANRSGIQMATVRNIVLAWVLTLPAAMLLSAGLYLFGHLVVGHVTHGSVFCRFSHNGRRTRASSTRARIPPRWISQSRPICALRAP